MACEFAGRTKNKQFYFVIRRFYFFYNGQEYALLTEDIDDLDSRAPDEEVEVFICQVAQIDDELEEFIPVDDELMEPLLKIAMTRFEALEDEDD